MDNDKIKIAEHEIKINQIVERIDSHFHNTKQQHDKIFLKLEQMPTEDRILISFSKEGEKLAKGILEQVKDVKGIAVKAQEIAEGAENEIKFAKRVWLGFAAIVALLGWEKFVNSVKALFT